MAAHCLNSKHCKYAESINVILALIFFSSDAVHEFSIRLQSMQGVSRAEGSIWAG